MEEEPEEEMRKKLLQNWGMKLASLVLAFVLWFLVVQSDNPKDTRTFANVPVKLTNVELLESENKVYEVLDNTDSVRVTVCAPRSTIDKLRASDIVAEADFSKLTDINTVAISYYINSSDIDPTTIDYYRGNHDVVRLNVEEKATKSIALKANIMGTPADGYMVGSVTLDQNLIEVSGPKSVVETLKEAWVDINVTNATNNLSANVDIQFYNESGNVVQSRNLKHQSSYAHISVEVLAVKEVPIEAVPAGTLAQGYMLTGVVECNPAAVKLVGTAIDMGRVTRIVIPKAAVDIGGASQDVVASVDLREYLPENVRLADGQFNGRVTVTVGVAAIQEKSLQIPVENLAVINVPAGYRAEILDGAESSYQLRVKGMQGRLAQLNGDAFKGTIDVGKWMEAEELTQPPLGAHLMPAAFVLGDGVEEVEPMLISITIKEL